MELVQYQIALVNLDSTIGSEMKKTRPCVIISPNEMNKHLNTVVIAPMTSSSKKYPTRLEISHNNQCSWIVLDQIRAVDKQRIVKIFGSLTEEQQQQIKSLIREIYID